MFRKEAFFKAMVPLCGYVLVPLFFLSFLFLPDANLSVFAERFPFVSLLFLPVYGLYLFLVRQLDPAALKAALLCGVCCSFTMLIPYGRISSLLDTMHVLFAYGAVIVNHFVMERTLSVFPRNLQIYHSLLFCCILICTFALAVVTAAQVLYAAGVSILLCSAYGRAKKKAA